ncbi:MAG: hypothetical protein V4635_14595 [Bacteroidota bacterium]
MKTISTIFLIILTQSVAFSQGTVNPDSNSGIDSRCTLNYSNEKWIITHKDPSPHVCTDMVIKSIPPASKAYTPIDLTNTIKGIYTFKKDSSLTISDEYNVVIEDLLTGKYFNMNTEQGYTYSVNRASGEKRFVVEISKNTVKPGSGSTASR